MKKELKTQLLLQIFTVVVSQTFCLLGNKVLALEEVYKLPFPEGMTYRISQGYDTGDTGGSHKGNLIYSIDFAMPNKSEIAATKSGAVVKLVESNTKVCFNRTYAVPPYIVHF